MTEYTDIKSLAAAALPQFEQVSGAVVAIEGHSTSGKSFLSKDLAARLGITAIGTDSFVRQRSTEATYLELIDTARLRREITQLTSAGSQVIVEGICLRDTLAAIGKSGRLHLNQRTTAQ
jgi:cytidylate kinase